MHCSLKAFTDLGPGETPYFTWAESNVNEGEQRVFLICIPFGLCEVQRLTSALVTFSLPKCQLNS